jgi:Ca-activated chloride channel family protein
MLPELIATALVLLAVAAEHLHAQRCRRVAALAFGPTGRPLLWARLAPLLRIASVGAVCWGMTTLLLLTPKAHKMGEIAEADCRHLLLVLDVSPSMRLEDAGPDGKQSRRKRAADLLTSFFERVPVHLYRVSIVATYTEAKPVVVDTRDLEVVRNILSDLPMQYAFPAGPTDLFAGLTEAAKMAHPWRPGSTTVVIVSDGDTVPAKGMPKLPASVKHVLVVGVGDANAGKFIDGHQSRQDASTLRQVAVRLGGTYHNGNQKHLPTDLLRNITFVGGQSVFEKLTRREYALIACGVGAAVLALLPFALHWAGTRWHPGVPYRRSPALDTKANSARASKKRLSVTATTWVESKG